MLEEQLELLMLQIRTYKMMFDTTRNFSYLKEIKSLHTQLMVIKNTLEELNKMVA